jgi:hypothetical protein
LQVAKKGLKKLSLLFLESSIWTPSHRCGENSLATSLCTWSPNELAPLLSVISDHLPTCGRRWDTLAPCRCVPPPDTVWSLQEDLSCIAPAGKIYDYARNDLIYLPKSSCKTKPLAPPSPQTYHMALYSHPNSKNDTPKRVMAWCHHLRSGDQIWGFPKSKYERGMSTQCHDNT